MSKPFKVGDRWRARVRINGHDRSKNFSTYREAELWIKQTEIEAETGTIAPKMLDEIKVSQVIKRYIAEVLEKRKNPKRDILFLKRAMSDYPQLFNKTVRNFGRLDVVAWKEARSKQVSDATVIREWNTISGCITHAIKVWGLPIENPFLQVKKPAKAKPRNRRISANEIEEIKQAFLWNETITQKKDYACWCFLFAIETGCRAGEILKLEWSDIVSVGDKAIAQLRETKNGADRNVPLNAEARRLIGLLPKDAEKPVLLSSAQLDSNFRKHRPAELRDLRFHDTRHEALSRMAKFITNPMDLAKISEHKDVNILMTVYYNPDNLDLLDHFD